MSTDARDRLPRVLPHVEKTVDWTDYRPVSAMFIDLEGSVALLSRIGPEAYNNALRAFHSMVTLNVRMFDGEVAQYLGDGVLCFFHRGRGSLDRASAAIAAGVEILSHAQSARQQSLGGLRIGIASGLALFNDEQTAAGTRVIGACINLAARLQAEAAPGTILSCDETRQSAAEHFDFQAMPARQLKGFPDDLRIWQVLGRKPGGQHPRYGFPASDAAALPVVGRDAELAQLEQALADTRLQQGRSVAILGEAGLGKTRLVEEFLRASAGSGCAALVLRCNRDEAGHDFHPIRTYLHWVVGVAPGDDQQARAAKLGGLFSAVWGLGPRQIDDLLLLLGAHPDKDAQPSDNPLALRRWFRDELIARLVEIRGNRPAIILVIEDAHWLDPSTAEMLAGLPPILGAERILLLFTQRTAGPLDRPALATNREIRLRPLSARQSTEMIRTILGALPTDDQALAWVRDKAGGVPLFVTAFAAFARRQSSAGFGGAALPLDLLDLLEQGLGRLPAATRRFVQAAAVMGSTFEPALIAALLNEDEDAMAGHLALLSQEQLIGQRPDGTGAGFAHDLLREAIYANLGAELRRRLHGTLAELMETGGPDAPAHILALHFDRAGRVAEAITHYHAASLSSARVGAMREAKDYLDKAFALVAGLEPPEQRLHQELALRSTEGPLQMVLGGPGSYAFGAAQRRSMELMVQLGMGQGRTHFLFNSGLHDWARLRLAEAEAQAREILALPGGGEEAQLAGHTLTGLVAWHRGENALARAHLGRTIALYRIEIHAGMYPKYLMDFGVFCLFYAGLTAVVSGDTAAARKLAARSQATSQTLEIPHAIGFGLLAQFMTALLAGDAEAATQHALEAEALAQAHRFPEFEAMAAFAQGWALSRVPASQAQGIARMIEGLEGWQRTDFLAWQSLFETILIEALMRAGRPDQAGHHLRDLKRRLAETGENQFLAPALIAEAYVLAARGEIAAAGDCLARASQHARTQQAQLWLDKAEAALTEIGAPPA